VGASGRAVQLVEPVVYNNSRSFANATAGPTIARDLARWGPSAPFPVVPAPTGKTLHLYPILDSN
jgi:hypothetical protein